MDNLYDIVKVSSAKYPLNQALSFHGQSMTYQQLDEAASRLAAGLSGLGIRHGERMGVMIPNSPHFAISFFALARMGVTVIPIHAHCVAANIAHQLADSEASGILFWEKFGTEVRKALVDLPGARHRIVLGAGSQGNEKRLTVLMEMHAPLQEVAPCDPDETAVILYTSGPSGKRMGVELTHSNILSNVEACRDFLQPRPADSVIGSFPLTYAFGHTLVMATFLSAGACIVLFSRFNAAEVVKAIAERGSAHWIAVPPMIRALLKEDQGRTNLRSLKYCVSTGDALDPETVKEFEEKYGVMILEGYGLAEATAMVSMNSPVRERRAGSIGLPLKGIDLRIVDESNSEVRPGQVGEIIVQGPGVMKGYWKHPEETSAILRHGWLYTGDMAKLHDNGYGFIVGRKKNVITKGGFQILPLEIEPILKSHPKIEEAVIVGIPDTAAGEEIHACIVLKAGESANAEELMEYCRNQMAPYKCPRFVHFLDSIPVGLTGRVMRQHLRSQMMSSIPKNTTKQMKRS